MTTMTKVLGAAAFILSATSAEASTYIRYEVLTAGSGTNASRFGEAPLTNLGFNFVVSLDGGTAQPLPSGNGVSFLSSAWVVGLTPDTATASYTDTSVTLTDRSLDHDFTATICAPAGVSFASLPTTSFGTSGCAVSFVASFMGRAAWDYSGRVVEVRTSTFTGTSVPAGLTLLSAVPEPASWALMLSGFMLTGYALRRRRATVTARFG